MCLTRCLSDALLYHLQDSRCRSIYKSNQPTTFLWTCTCSWTSPIPWGMIWQTWRPWGLVLVSAIPLYYVTITLATLSLLPFIGTSLLPYSSIHWWHQHKLPAGIWIFCWQAHCSLRIHTSWQVSELTSCFLDWDGVRRTCSSNTVKLQFQRLAREGIIVTANSVSWQARRPL